jgi:hypothetical protein
LPLTNSISIDYLKEAGQGFPGLDLTLTIEKSPYPFTKLKVRTSGVLLITVIE